jgi:hypothetical protein
MISGLLYWGDFLQDYRLRVSDPDCTQCTPTLHCLMPRKCHADYGFAILL